MYAIKRAINGISINGDEFLLNDDGSTMFFATEALAWKFICRNGISGCDVVPCAPDGVTKEIKPYPTIWGYVQDLGKIVTVEVMIPVPGDHPCLLTLEQLESGLWTITSEGYD